MEGSFKVLCDRRIHIKLKGKIYRTIVRLAMMYGSECKAVNKQRTQKMGKAKMRMSRSISSITRKNLLMNKFIQNKL